MPKFIEPFLDEAFVPDPDWTPERENTEQQQRLLRQIVMARHAMELKRRLGVDATADELSNDKKLARQVLSRLLNAHRIWGGTAEEAEAAYRRAVKFAVKKPRKNDPNPPLTDQLIAGAQVDWPEWWQAHRTYLRNHVRIVATTAMRLGQRKVANTMAHRFVNEWNTLDDLLSPLLQHKAHK